ncbi:hypothetical protein KAI32_03990 [Candidatus Pacearchaeota archaeon]|nr:hypothetical protein [Candidatus Pacearchaeota archaeon]
MIVEKKSEEDEKEIEEVLEDEDEFSEDDVKEVLEDEENFDEVSDFSIGDVGLKTTDTVDSLKGVNLENSLGEEFLNKWEERHEESSDEKFYGGGNELESRNYGGESEQESRNYSEINQRSNLYIEDGQVRDLYSTNSEDGSGFYDPRIGKVADKDWVRPVGPSKLEIVGLREGFGCSIGNDLKTKKDDRKYH